jgi:hypothetical protein
MPILSALILWSFVIRIEGSTITTNRWLRDPAVLSHLGPVPVTRLDRTAIAWLIVLGVAGASGHDGSAARCPTRSWRFGMRVAGARGRSTGTASSPDHRMQGRDAGAVD